MSKDLVAVLFVGDLREVARAEARPAIDESA